MIVKLNSEDKTIFKLASAFILSSEIDSFIVQLSKVENNQVTQKTNSFVRRQSLLCVPSKY